MEQTGAVAIASFISFLPIILMQLVMVALFWKLADRLAVNKVLYVILMIIPIVGSFYTVYLGVRALVSILDKLDALAQKP